MYEEPNLVLGRNLDRVANLISLYGPPVQGRRKVADTDLLRAAIVLLHAGLEEYLRSLLILGIDSYSPEILNRYSFPNGNRRGEAKISLGQLASYRGKKVGAVIRDVVKEHLEQFQTFNDIGDVKTALRQLGIPRGIVEAHDFSSLPEMIVRRHQIVHRADRNDVQGGQGNHKVAPIGLPKVQSYVASFSSMREMVTHHLQEK